MSFGIHRNREADGGGGSVGAHTTIVHHNAPDSAPFVFQGAQRLLHRAELVARALGRLYEIGLPVPPA